MPPPQIPPGGDRLPKIAPELWDDAQRAAAAALIATPRGEVRGPFVPLIRSAELLDRTQALGEFIRYRCSVPERLRELAICIVAADWHQAYEWHAHARLALAAGVSREAIAAIAGRSPPIGLTEDEAVVHGFVTELLETRFVADATYGEALALLGEKGVVELSALCGYYTLLAMVMNVARTPCPGEPFAIPDQAL